MRQAFIDAQGIERSGYVQRGFPVDARQKLSDHLHFTGQLASFMGGNDAYNNDLKYYGEIHDIPEVIASDFTPRDNIPRDEKFALENIAARIVFSDEDYVLWHRNERGTDGWAQFARECDALEIPLHCLTVEFKYPALKGQIDGFWSSVSKKIQTGLGQFMHDELRMYRYGVQRTGQLGRAFHQWGEKVAPSYFSTQAVKSRYIQRMYNQYERSMDNLMSGAS